MELDRVAVLPAVSHEDVESRPLRDALRDDDGDLGVAPGVDLGRWDIEEDDLAAAGPVAEARAGERDGTAWARAGRPDAGDGEAAFGV